MVSVCRKKTVRIHPFHNIFQETISKTMFSHCVESTCPLEFIGWSITFMKSAYLWTGCMVLWQQILQASSFWHYKERWSVDQWGSGTILTRQMIKSSTLLFIGSHTEKTISINERKIVANQLSIVAIFSPAKRFTSMTNGP